MKIENNVLSDFASATTEVANDSASLVTKLDATIDAGLTSMPALEPVQKVTLEESECKNECGGDCEECKAEAEAKRLEEEKEWGGEAYVDLWEEAARDREGQIMDDIARSLRSFY